jgi:SAM-dependent methyltransferase
MSEPPADPITDDAVDVGETAAVYAAEAEAFVEKYRGMRLTDRYGDQFREGLPDPEGRPPRVLDTGCGPGVDTEWFDEFGLDALGLDITDSFLREARTAAPSAAFVRADMRDLPLRDGAVDGVWSSASFLHLPRSAAASTLAEFARVLRPGGVLLLSVMARETRAVDAVELEDGRQFTFWREDALRDRLTAAGFSVDAIGDKADWHALCCSRE